MPRNGMHSTFSAYLVYLIGAFFFFYGIIQLSAFNTLGPYLLRDFHLSSTTLGLLASAHLYTIVIILLPTGVFLDKYLTRTPALIALLLATMGALLFGAFHTLWAAVVFRILAGFGNGVAFLVAIRVANYWFPTKKALATSLVISIGLIGGMLSGGPFSLLIEYVGWHTALLIDGALGFALWCLAFFLLQNHPNEYSERTKLTWQQLKRLFRNTQNIICGLFTGGLNLSVYVIASLWGSLYLTQEYSLSNAEAGTIISMIFLGIIIGSPIFGSLSDVIQRRKPVMLIGAGLSIAALCAIIFIPHLAFYPLLVLFLLLGVTTSSQVLIYPTIAESNPISFISTATSCVALVVDSIGAMVQILFGWILSIHWNGTMNKGIPLYAHHNWHFAMLGIAFLFSLSLIAATRLKETHCRSIVKT